MTDTAAPSSPGMDRRALLIGAATASVAGVFAVTDPVLAQVSAVVGRSDESSDATPYGVGSPF